MRYRKMRPIIMKHVNLKSNNIVTRIVDKLSGTSEMDIEAESQPSIRAKKEGPVNLMEYGKLPGFLLTISHISDKLQNKFHSEMSFIIVDNRKGTSGKTRLWAYPIVFVNASTETHEISGRVLNSVLVGVSKELQADHTEQANTWLPQFYKLSFVTLSKAF